MTCDVGQDDVRRCPLLLPLQAQICGWGRSPIYVDRTFAILSGIPVVVILDLGVLHPSTDKTPTSWFWCISAYNNRFLKKLVPTVQPASAAILNYCHRCQAQLQVMLKLPLVFSCASRLNRIIHLWRNLQLYRTRATNPMYTAAPLWGGASPPFLKSSRRTGGSGHDQGGGEENHICI